MNEGIKDGFKVMAAIAVTSLAAFLMASGYENTAMNITGRNALNLHDSDIRKISRSNDYNGDGIMDYLVKYKDGRTSVFYGKGFDEEIISQEKYRKLKN